MVASFQTSAQIHHHLAYTLKTVFVRVIYFPTRLEAVDIMAIIGRRCLADL
jgi:hypothetical protein